MGSTSPAIAEGIVLRDGAAMRRILIKESFLKM
jgi:hypothetical protein